MAQEFSGRKAMGAIGSPVVLVSSAYNGQMNVTTVNMIAGISFKPPQLCISLSHRSFTSFLIEQSREFAVNVVSPVQLDLVRKIGSTSGHKIDKFEEFSIEHFRGEKTSCPLLSAAHTVLECEVNPEHTIKVGTQNLYIANVVAYHEAGKGYPLYLYHGRYYAIGEQIGSYRPENI